MSRAWKKHGQPLIPVREYAVLLLADGMNVWCSWRRSTMESPVSALGSGASCWQALVLRLVLVGIDEVWLAQNKSYGNCFPSQATTTRQPVLPGLFLTLCWELPTLSWIPSHAKTATRYKMDRENFDWSTEIRRLDGMHWKHICCRFRSKIKQILEVGTCAFSI